MLIHKVVDFIIVLKFILINIFFHLFYILTTGCPPFSPPVPSPPPPPTYIHLSNPLSPFREGQASRGLE